MNLLVDTHVAIWLVSSPERLPDKITSLLVDEANRVFVSAISIWETSIKFALHKPSSPPFPGRELLRLAVASGCEMLVVKEAHASAVDDLPLLHGDPFDRLLIAQALSEPMRLISADRQVAAYSDTVISW
ncbi:type II toxin-antitoxin system VapC family toxin [Mesorhizobium sp. IMUNJ 23232]|uniref:type II toxin-antitoxin system VapC family toxin n=1 Tax=Mesorhizobium sp. IMUNJ 23232 TaxID=3376064 RepID=UPI00378D3F09